MTPDQFAAVDHYLVSQLVAADPVLDAVLAASEAAGLPPINVAPNQGKLLHLLARIAGARRVLEVGTLGGYSTLWLARALPLGGRVVTLEIDAKHAAVARSNFARAGLAHVIELREGRAVETLDAMIAAGEAPFDFVFVDADKTSNTEYVWRALALSHSGTVIVIDNVVRNGAVADPSTRDTSALGVRRLNDYLATEPRLATTAVQTVGSKGWDGFALALVV